MRIVLPFLVFLGLQLSFSQDYSYSSIPEDLLKNADAVVRNHRMEANLISERNLEISYQRIVTVLNEKGNQHTRSYVGYNNSMNIRSISAEIYDKSGNLIKKLKKKDFLDVSAVDGGTLYSDSRILIMRYLPTDYPYTVNFSYEIRTENTGTIPAWYFMDDFLVSTEKNSYTINFEDPGLKPIVLERNFEGFSIESFKSNSTIQYSTSNIQAIKDEELRPSLDKVLPRLVVSPTKFYYEGYLGNVNTWKEAGQWMNENLLEGQDELDPKTISLVRNLVSGTKDTLDMAKLIYKYVQENTRYISVQVGIGGLRPISAIEVDRVKYGDCKGLANYTKALLKAVGIPSYYVHVEAGSDKVDFEDEVASFAQGNHVILAIPYNNKYHWIDCTSQVHPFGFLGDFTDDRKVLLMKPEGGEIARTDAYLNQDNLQVTNATFKLAEDGSLHGEALIKTHGIQYDNHFYLEDLAQSDVQKYYKNYWSNINNLKIVGYKFENNKENIIFEERVEVWASKYAAQTDEKLVFVANSFNNNQYVPPRYRNRKFPLEIQRGYLDEDEYEIALPESYGIESLPENRNIENKFGAYSTIFEVEDGKIILKRKLFIKAGTYPNSDYNEYRDFRRNIAKLDNSKIVLIRKI